MGEGLWGVDTSLVQNAVDAIVCNIKVCEVSSRECCSWLDSYVV